MADPLSALKQLLLDPKLDDDFLKNSELLYRRAGVLWRALNGEAGPGV